MTTKIDPRELDATSMKRMVVVTKETSQYRIDLLKDLRNGSIISISGPLPPLDSLAELDLWRSHLKQRRQASTRILRIPTRRPSPGPRVQSQIIPTPADASPTEEQQHHEEEEEEEEHELPIFQPGDIAISQEEEDHELPIFQPGDIAISQEEEDHELPVVQDRDVAISPEEEEPLDEPPAIPSEGESLPPAVPLCPSILTLAVSVPDALRETSSLTVEAIPVGWYSDIRARGFGSLFFTEFPDDGNIDVVRSKAAEANLKVIAIPTIDENATSPILLPPEPETGLQYCYDPTLLQKLRAGDWDAFVAAVESRSVARLNFVYFTTHPFELSTGLLLLPGLRVIRGADSVETSSLLRILLRQALGHGVFSIPEFHRTFGRMVVWKYNTDVDRILVCLNFVNSHAVTDIVCPDAPDAVGTDKIEVFELLSETTFRRDPNEMRTKGLHVILHEYQVQVFSY